MPSVQGSNKNCVELKTRGLLKMFLSSLAGMVKFSSRQMSPATFPNLVPLCRPLRSPPRLGDAPDFALLVACSPPALICSPPPVNPRPQLTDPSPFLEYFAENFQPHLANKNTGVLNTCSGERTYSLALVPFVFVNQVTCRTMGNGVKPTPGHQTERPLLRCYQHNTTLFLANRRDAPLSAHWPP